MDEGVEPMMSSELRDYWVHNIHSSTLDIVWDAFKVYARGWYQFTTAKVRKESEPVL